MNEKPIIVTGRRLALSEAVRRRNPELFGAGPAVREVEANGAEQAPSRALGGRPKRFKKRGGRVALRVSLVAMRRRLLDPDAVSFACKNLTDAIAQSLGVDDADKRVVWEWQQVQTSGKEGVIVKIEKV